MIEIRFSGVSMEDLKRQMNEFIEPRRKVVPGEKEKSDTTLAEVQAALYNVKEKLGDEYVNIILDRIPSSSIAKLRVSEYDRVVRLCCHYLDKNSIQKSQS